MDRRGDASSATEHITMLLDYAPAEQRFVATPNQDVVYGFGMLALDQGPVVVQVPDFQGRSGCTSWVTSGPTASESLATPHLVVAITVGGEPALADDVGPARLTGAARLLVEVGDITRFQNKAHFASWKAPSTMALPSPLRPAPSVRR